MKPIITLSRLFLVSAMLLLGWQNVNAQVTIQPIFGNPYSTCIPASSVPLGYEITNLTGTNSYIWSVQGDLEIDYTAAGGTEVYLHSQATDADRQFQPYGKGRLCVTYYDSVRSTICGDPIVCYDIYKIFEDTLDNIVGPTCIAEGDTVTYSIKALVSVNLNAEIGIDGYYWDATSGLIDQILYYSGDSSSITFVAGALTGADTLFVDMGQCNLADGYRYALPIGQSIDSLSFVAGHGPECLSFSTTSYTFEINPQTGVTYEWEILGSWSYTGSNMGSTFTVVPDQSEAFIRITASNDCADRIFTYRINRTLDSSNNILGDTCLLAGTTAQFTVNGIGSGVQIQWNVSGTGWSIAPGQQGATATITVGTATGTITATAANCQDTVSELIVYIKPFAPTPIYGDTCIPYGVTDTLTYSVDPVANASGYIWFIPSGWTPVNLPSGTTLDVIPNGTTPGQIGIAAIGCDTSAITYINVGYGSQTPDTILASETCLNAGVLDSIIFSVGTPIPGETYEWDIPAGLGTVLNYQSTSDSSEVQVQTNGTPGNYIIRVRAYTLCGTSDWDTLVYTINGYAFTVGYFEIFTGYYAFSVSPNTFTNGGNFVWTVDGNVVPGTTGIAIFGLPGEVCFQVTDTTTGCSTTGCWVNPSMMRMSGKNAERLYRPLENEQIRLYPNPTKDRLSVEFGTAGVYELYLISNNGKIVLHEKTDSPKHQMDVSNLPSGTYFLGIKSNEGQTVKTVVITH